MRVINFTGDTWCVRVDEGDVEGDAARIADALGRLVLRNHGQASVYVGYDARPLSAVAARAAAGTLAARGVRARLSDTHCPTAALCEATRRDGSARAALMVTAGNRSGDYFGVRVRMADGSAATPSDVDVLEELIEPRPPEVRGTAEPVDLITPYLERLARGMDGTVFGGRVPTIVCDPMLGAQTSHAARLLASSGARVIELHDDGDEGFGGIHPEVVEPWIDDCEQAVVDYGADFGIAIDGAGDRLALVDERGKMVTPHLLVALIMEELVRGRGLAGRMVAPIFVSTVVRRQAKRLGLPLTVTPAGFMWMREEMGQGDVVCAADALGGVCVPALGLERDALAAASVLVEGLMRDGRSVSALVSELSETLGHMEYGQTAVRMGSGSMQVLRNALPGINPARVAGMVPSEVTHPGGLMVRFPDESWLLVRPSRSSNVARVYAEAATASERDDLLAAGRALASSPLS